jgi:hypothetical protein
LRTNDVGASSGTLRAWRSFIPLSTSTAASSSRAPARPSWSALQQGRRVAPELGEAVADQGRKSKSSGWASVSASVMLSLNTSHGMIASMAANGSPPDCLASSRARPMREYSRTLSLIALPDCWKRSAWLRLALLNSEPMKRSCRSMISSISVARVSRITATRVA